MAIYKSKKDQEPITVIAKGEFKREVSDEGLKGENKVRCNRNMTVLELKENVMQVKMWIYAAMDISHNFFASAISA